MNKTQQNQETTEQDLKSTKASPATIAKSLASQTSAPAMAMKWEEEDIMRYQVSLGGQSRIISLEEVEVILKEISHLKSTGETLIKDDSGEEYDIATLEQFLEITKNNLKKQEANLIKVFFNKQIEEADFNAIITDLVSDLDHSKINLSKGSSELLRLASSSKILTKETFSDMWNTYKSRCGFVPGELYFGYVLENRTNHTTKNTKPCHLEERLSKLNNIKGIAPDPKGTVLSREIALNLVKILGLQPELKPDTLKPEPFLVLSGPVLFSDQETQTYKTNKQMAMEALTPQLEHGINPAAGLPETSILFQKVLLVERNVIKYITVFPFCEAFVGPTTAGLANSPV
jgi:hypothetical protein